MLCVFLKKKKNQNMNEVNYKIHKPTSRGSARVNVREKANLRVQGREEPPLAGVKGKANAVLVLHSR